MSLQQSKPYPSEKKEAFSIIGITCRTTNAHGQAMKDIPLLWARFQQEPIKDKITTRLSDDLYVLYTDFVNQNKENQGSYTMLIGFRVPEDSPTPEGMQKVTVPQGNYARFSAQGDPQTVVFQTWQNIWARAQNDNDFEKARTYTTEVEHYHKDGIDIYIGLSQ